MIEVIYDQFRLEKADGTDFEIEEDNQYDVCVDKMRTCAESQQHLRIFIRNPGIYGWFDSVRKKFGAVLRIKDPIKELSALMSNAKLPNFLKNKPELVVKLRLIEKVSSSPKKENESLDRWIVRLLLGSAWSNEELTSDEQLIAILNWYLDESKASLHPAILEIANERLIHWAESSTKGSMLFKWLQPDPFNRCRLIALEQLLTTYPKNRVAEWFQYEGIWAVLSQFPDRHQVLPQWADMPSIQLPPAIATSIRSFLKEEWENRSPFASLSYISGRLDHEIAFILENLRLQMKNGQAIDRRLYDMLSEVTNSHPQIMALAETLLPASPPNTLSDQADVSEVRSWLKEQYLPFYRSCSLLKRLNSTLESITSFQTWFKEHYPKLIVNGHGMAYRQIQTLKEILHDNAILLIIVDGLDYLTAEIELLPALIEKGLFPDEDMLPYFSFLPSETHIAKPALLRGKMPSQIPEENPSAAYYSSLVQEAFGLNSAAVRAATNKDMSLEELVGDSANLYLYLDNHLDAELLHAQFSPAVRQKRYAEHLKNLAFNIADAGSLYKDLFGRELIAVVASDHGYTEIPDGVKVIKSSEKAKSRSAVVTDESFSSGEVWELTPEDLFGLHKKMAIPWGYDCFGSKPRGATHGGSTPQEIAVPWIVINRSKPSPLIPLMLHLEGSIYRRQKENRISLCISNPNEYSIKILQIQMQWITFTETLHLKVGPNAVKKIACQCDASDIASNFVEISGNYSMERMGEKKTVQFKLEVETVGAMLNEFDDTFDI